MQPALAFPVRPIKVAVPIEGRSAAQLLLCDIGAEPTQPGVIIQLVPGYRMLLFADSEKASERHHGVRHFAGLFVNHQSLNRTDVIALRIVHGCPFYAIALDERLAGHHAGSIRRDADSTGRAHLSLLVIEANEPPAEVCPRTAWVLGYLETICPLPSTFTSCVRSPLATVILY